MGVLIRILIGVPIAAIITFALFTLMQILIFTEDFNLEEAGDELEISISDVEDDIEVRRRDLTPDDVQETDPPPPPPQIERQRAEQPSEDLSTIVGDLPEFEAPSLSDTVSFSVSDRDAQPLVRIEPQYPPRAAERGVEGQCTVTFDVTADGTPTNIRILNCDSSLFERASIRAVERWRYQPKIVEGQAVARTGVVTRFDFELSE
jgi:protein TonB